MNSYLKSVLLAVCVVAGVHSVYAIDDADNGRPLIDFFAAAATSSAALSSAQGLHPDRLLAMAEDAYRLGHYSYALAYYELLTNHNDAPLTYKVQAYARMTDIWYVGWSGREKNYAKALECAAFVERNKNLLSQTEYASFCTCIGQMYCDGGFGVQQNFAAAVRWFSYVINIQGANSHDSLRAYLGLAQIWLDSRNQDPIKYIYASAYFQAVLHIQEANDLAKARANLGLGIIYYKGKFGIRRNVDDARGYFEAVLGFPYALKEDRELAQKFINYIDEQNMNEPELQDDGGSDEKVCC